MSKRSAYKLWTPEEKKRFIQSRICLDELFDSKQRNFTEGWKKVIEIAELSYDINNCRKQWQNLIKKYKQLYQESIVAGEDMNDRTTIVNLAIKWEYFEILHNYASKITDFHRPDLKEKDIGQRIKREADATNYEIEDDPLGTINYDSIDGASSTPSITSDQVYLHKRPKIDHQIEKLIKRDKKYTKKLNSLLSIVGQIIKKEYSEINVDKLVNISDTSDSD